MRSGLIAKKIGMSSLFKETGERFAVTFLKVEDCKVLDRKTSEKDGYDALVIGAFNAKANNLAKPLKGYFSKINVEPKKRIKEFRITPSEGLEPGTNLDVGHFSENQLVDVTGISIGKGFAGGMKRHNFRGLEASHGVSISHRSHGSTGGRQDPGKVFKNKKMAGHMGARKVTIQNLKILGVDKENSLIMIGGAVPGSKGSYVYIKDSVKKTISIS